MSTSVTDPERISSPKLGPRASARQAADSWFARQLRKSCRQYARQLRAGMLHWVHPVGPEFMAPAAYHYGSRRHELDTIGLCMIRPQARLLRYVPTMPVVSSPNRLFGYNVNRLAKP